MATPEVRVRLSADGVAEVVSALRKVEAEADRAGKKSAKSLDGMKGALGEIKKLLPTISAAVVVAGFTRMAKAAFEAADAVADAAKVAGVSATDFSRLAYAAKQSDVELGALSTGIKKLQINLSGAGEDVKASVEALANLGLEARDLKGLRLEDQLGLIADRFRLIQDPADQTRIAVALFGRAGADLIPLLQQGAAGMRNFAAEADRLGITLSEETAAGIDRLDEAAKRLKATLQGKIQSWLGELSLAVLGSGDKRLDELTQKIVRLNQARQQLTTGGPLVDGSPDAVRLREVKEQLAEAIKQRQIYIDQKKGEAAADAAASQAKSDQLAKEIAAQKALAEKPAREKAASDKDTAAKAAAREAERAAAEKRKAAEDEARRLEQLAQDRAALEERLLELAGQTKEARLAGLEEEIRKADELLQAQKVGDAERLAILEKLRTTGTAAINFDALEAEATRTLQTVAGERQRIENEVALGLLTQVEGQTQIAQIEAARLVVLQQIVAAAQAAAEATTNQESIARAQQLAVETQNLEVGLKKTSEAFKDVREGAEASAASGIATFLVDVGTGAKSASEGIRAFAANFAAAIAQMIAQELALMAVKSALRAFGFSAGGEVQGLAVGGRVTGPGTGTSDSIPAYLSAGEYVIRAAVVAQPGVLAHLEALNAGMSTPPLRTPRQRFASGGLATPAPSAPAAAERPVRIVNVLDKNLMEEALSSSAGERVLLNVLQRNKSGIQRLLRS